MAETPFLQDVDGCMDAVEAEESGQFSALIARARLDPREQLRYGDFSHCAFDGDDMRGFDFSGCNLLNTTFAGARIDAAVFDLANVSLAALRAAADFDAWLKADLARPAEARRRIAAARLPDLATFREAPWRRKWWSSRRASSRWGRTKATTRPTTTRSGSGECAFRNASRSANTR